MKGQTVTHRCFGKGTITAVDNGVMTVRFSGEEKRFVYPDALMDYLSLADKTKQKQVEARLAAEEEKKARERAAAERQRQREYKIENFKVNSVSQAAFDVTHDPQALTNWRVGTGTYISGLSKGKPRIPKRLMPNSACLLTLRPEGKPEAQRAIVGAFMVERDFFGDECKNGVVAAHPEHRLALNAGECLPFWRFFGDKSRVSWGNTEFKYFSNASMQAILAELCSLCTGENRKKAEDFFLYFKKLNNG